MTNRYDLLNYLIKKINGKKYLEIGVEGGENFFKIVCEHKIGVDPNTQSKATHFMTSDEFFKKNTETFDVIFIDGLHQCEQVYLDIINGLHVLNDNGYIVCHDLNPPDENSQCVPRNQDSWTGDCWKAWVKLRFENLQYNMQTVILCSGCGVIYKNNPTPIPNIKLPTDTFNLSYVFLEENRRELLNLVSVNEYIKSLEKNVNLAN